MKKILCILFLIVKLIYSKEIFEKKKLRYLGELKYSCNVEKKNMIRIVGKNFIGYINRNGKLYGEVILKNNDSKFCFGDKFFKSYRVIGDKKIYYFYDLELGYELYQDSEDSFSYISEEIINSFRKNRKGEYSLVEDSMITLFSGNREYYLEIDESKID